VVAAEYWGFEADSLADVAVCNLEGSGIPALRNPQQSVLTIGGRGMGDGAMMSVAVLVPSDHVAEARELIEGDQP
jgi:hypothetical protein